MDVREWLSIDPEGMPRTIEQTRGDLKSLLAVPPDQRVPPMQFFWTHVSAGHATVIYWICLPRKTIDAEGKTHESMFGTLLRDLLARTPDGWRRTRHEKIFANQLIAVDGRSVISAQSAR